MSWLNGLSQSEKDEMFLDACAAFNSGIITDFEFRQTLAKLGYNATDIADCVKQHKPEVTEE